MPLQQCGGNRPHQPQQNRVSRFALLDVIAYLSYEAAIASDQGNLGCIAIGLVADSRDDVLLATVPNRGQVPEIRLAAGRLTYGGRNMADLFTVRRDADVGTTRQRWHDASNRVVQEMLGETRAMGDAIVEAMRQHQTGRPINFQRIMRPVERRQRAVQDAQQIEEGRRAAYRTAGPDYTIRQSMLLETERILNTSQDPYAQMIRDLLMRDGQLRLMNPPGDGRVLHAEMALTSVVLTARPNFVYIGIDKLPCYSCYYMLQSIFGGGLINANFRTAPVLGTHGHVFANWKAPELPSMLAARAVPSPCPACTRAAEALGTIAGHIERWQPSRGNTGADQATLKIQTIDPYAIFELFA